jgi:hypothetical protein
VRFNLLEQEEISMDQYLKSAFDVLERDIKKALDSKEEVPVKEGIDSIIGLWLSGPYVVKVFGNFLKYLDKVVKHYNKKGIGLEEIAEKIINFSEKYHHFVMKPFELLVSKFTKDKSAGKDLANLMFYTVVLVLLGKLGVDLGDAIASAKIDSGVVIKAVKAGIKGAEIWEGLALSLKMVAAHFLKGKG